MNARADAPPSAPSVIYIAGGGHSGSTLLDLMIGAAPEAFSTGELKFYSEYVEQSAAGIACTCGQAFDSCSFWSQVRGRQAHPYRIGRSADVRAVVRLMVQLILGRQAEESREDNEALIAGIGDVARGLKPGLRYVVDSSKDAFRLQRLGAALAQRVTVIHLIRDGRGYIHAYNNNRRRRDGLRVKSAVRAYVEWIVLNLMVILAARRLRLRRFTISYDRLCADPAAYAAYLNHALGLTIPADVVAGINATAYHNVEGNWMRLRPLTAIRLDSAWRHEMPAWKRILISVLVAPFNRVWVERDDVARGRVGSVL